MRKIVAGLFVSLDGVVEAPHRWQFEHFDEDVAAAMTAQLAGVDTMLLGRVTYQDWAPYWSTSTDEPYASHINRTPKYVVSTALDRVAWGDWDNVTLIRENVTEELTRLKRQPGRDIGIGGSPTLVGSLLRQDLLDELLLLVHPVVVGRGKRLFREGGEVKRLNLADARTSRTGVAILTYRP
ncbi:dihydrofolate reductase family protein [Deinococcus aluminii]|uniref:Uncharacterized protein YyaP n=1 Tax=Deinococcus aluminii TaxID=1656885 RepID=A0ABP9X9F9_9DEIO